MNSRIPTRWLCVLCWLWLLPGAASAQVKVSARELPLLPDKLGVAGAFAGVSGDALIVAGGANFPGKPPWENGIKKWHDEIYVLPYGATNWLTGSKLPHPLGYGVSLNFDDGVLCIGGNDAERHHREVFLLRWRDGRVLVETNFPALPEPLANACGAICMGQVYIIGGETTPGATRAMASAWRLNPKAQDASWIRLPDCPGPGRTLAVAGASGNQVYVAGGVALSAGADGKPVRRYLSGTYVLTHGGHAWETRKDLPIPLAAVPGPIQHVANGWFALFGGDDGSHYGFQPPNHHPGFSLNILLWHPERELFHIAGQLKLSCVTTRAVLWRDEIIVPGGEVRPGVRSPVVTAYRVEDP